MLIFDQMLDVCMGRNVFFYTFTCLKSRMKKVLYVLLLCEAEGVDKNAASRVDGTSALILRLGCRTMPRL